MKRITQKEYRDILAQHHASIARKGKVWVGQIGDNYDYDQTDAYGTATAAAKEIVREYNSGDYDGCSVRVCLISDDFDFCYREIVIREGLA